MNIGELAGATSTKAETIRYYEKIGLLTSPSRSASNYRTYGDDDVIRLKFVRRARGLGFPVEHVREMLDLADRHDHDCCKIDDMTRENLDMIDRKIADLSALKQELAEILNSCHGGIVANCKVLKALGSR